MDNHHGIRIGTRISPDWLQRSDHLSFLRQIGIEHVDITLDAVGGYTVEGGRFERDALARVIDILASADLTIERANFLTPELLPVYLNTPNAGRVVENVCHALELLGEADVPVMGLQCFQAASVLPSGHGKPAWREGRGGYRYLEFDLGDSPERGRTVADQLTADQLWERMVELYRVVLPVAESADVRIAMHGNDPPVPRLGGIPQIMCRFTDFERLFREAPSTHNGMTFCVGTRYESGEDVFDGINSFGSAGRIFHVHFRNVRGTIPGSDGYSERAPDDGDLDMFAVARTLADTGYTGVIDHDHVLRLAGDGESGLQYIAFCVGHMRGLLSALR